MADSSGCGRVGGLCECAGVRLGAKGGRPTVFERRSSGAALVRWCSSELISSGTAHSLRHQNPTRVSDGAVTCRTQPSSARRWPRPTHYGPRPRVAHHTPLLAAPNAVGWAAAPFVARRSGPQPLLPLQRAPAMPFGVTLRKTGLGQSARNLLSQPSRSVTATTKAATPSSTTMERPS